MKKLYIILVLLLIICVIPEFLRIQENSPILDYSRNGFIEILGIIITLFFVEKIVARQKQEDEKQDENKKISRIDRIIKVALENCTQQTNFMTGYLANETVKKGFEFNRLEHFFIPSLNIFDLNRKSYKVFFQNTGIILDVIKHSFINIDFKYNKELERLLREYFEFMSYGNIENAFDGYEYNPDILKAMKEMIKSIPVGTVPKYEDYPSSLFCSFIRLYEVINYHIEFVGRYTEVLERIQLGKST